jgi:hypothetical protein
MDFGQLLNWSAWLSPRTCLIYASVFQLFLSTYLGTSYVFFIEGRGRLLQRVLDKCKGRSRVPRAQEFRDQEQIMRPSVGNVDRCHL